MVQIAKLVRKKLGEVLIDEGLIKEEHIADVLRRQRAHGEGFGEILVSMGLVSEIDIARTLVKQSGLPYIDASKYRINKDGVQALPGEFQWLNSFVVLDKIGKTLLVAISNILPGEIFDKIEKTSGSQIFVYVSTASQVKQALEKNVPINGKLQDPKAAAPAKPGAKPGASAAPGAAKPAAPAATATAVRPASPATASSSTMQAAPQTQVQPRK
ncbi:MAG TPA: hypothetical protein VNM14_05640 [Planctomycetota bacterium]|jgi:hypothetical protein|nr:hypothetical protein [Planctomycetota bacterium]